MRLNTKSKPFWLHRAPDYPQLVEWASLQEIVLHDVSEGRALMVDGAFALLHIVRISLHRDAKSPVYKKQWKFDEERLTDKWNGHSGRSSVLETLTDEDNYNLPVRVKDLSASSRKVEIFRERAEQMLHSLEILMDRQVQVKAEDGIHISHPGSLRRGRSIAGFDVMDLVKLLGPIESRIHNLNFSGNGWLDILPAMQATVIFRICFGELVVPRDLDNVCDH